MPACAPRRVLVVEDDANTRALIGVVLHPAYQVTCVPGLDQALDAAARTTFDALLIDINLGRGGCGTDLLRRLRAQPHHAHTPAVALTAYALLGDREAFLAAGFDQYQSKPFTRGQLLDTMEQALGLVTT